MRRSAVLAGVVGVVVAGFAWLGQGCGDCRIDGDPPRTPAERAVARTINAYIDALASRDPARACQQLTPSTWRSVQDYQENYHDAAYWMRCGERAFFHPEIADEVFGGGRAQAVTIWGNPPRMADALVPHPSDPGSGTRFFLNFINGRWMITGIGNIGCSGGT